MSRFLLSLLVLSIGLLAAPALALAQDQQVSWDRYDVQFELLPDGDFVVTETQVIDFRGTFRRAFREISLERTTGITDVEVGEPNKPYRPGTNSTDGYTVTTTDENTLRVEWFFPETRNAKRTFVLSYRVQGALWYYEQGDQLYWLAVYDDRVGPVRSSTVTVLFPKDVPTDQVRAEANPSSEARVLEIEPRQVVFGAEDLPASVGLEIRVQFPHGIVAGSPPPWQESADAADAYNQNVKPILDFLLLLAGLAVPLVGGAIVLLTWYARGKDPAVSGVPSELDQPPSDLPPGLVGTLVDEQADVQDVLATLLDLGRRDVIRIEEKTNAKLVGSSRDFGITQIEDEPKGLREYEKTVLKALLAGGKETSVSAMKGRFTAHIPLFQQQLYDEVARAGLFKENPERARKRFRTLATVLIAVSLGGWVLASFIFGGRADLGHLPFIGLGIVGIGLAFSARAMAQRTRAGALEAARWRAFGRHLAKTEQRNGDAGEMERYLPYSVALGVDKDWLRNFNAVGTPAPHWYGAAGGLPGSPGYGGRGGYGPGGIPPIIMLPGGGRGRRDRGSEGGGGGSSGDGGWGIPSGQDASDSAAGGVQNWSDSLADLLNNASEALSRGGGSGGWSGGGGGWGGGGGGGGSRGGGGFG